MLLEIYHHSNYGINFRSGLDDYVTASFQWDAKNLSIEEVKPEVDGLGVRPIAVKRRDGYWDATFKLPPGLAAGWHSASLRIGSSGRSNVRRLAVNMPVVADHVEIRAVCDGQTWKQNEIDSRKGNVVAMWIAGLPENADMNNVRAFLDGEAHPGPVCGAREWERS